MEHKACLDRAGFNLLTSMPVSPKLAQEAFFFGKNAILK